MFPLLPDEKRRKVNLGGRSGPSHSAVINDTKFLRNLRQHQKLQADSAARIQAQWRDMLGINGLRAMVLLAEDEMLARWAGAVLARGEGTLFSIAQPHCDSWLVLIRRVASLLVNSVAEESSGFREGFLRILNLLLAPVIVQRHLGNSAGNVVLSSISSYLLDRKFLELISVGICSIPAQSKKDPCLPLLVPLLAIPFEIFPADSPQYTGAIGSTFFHVLTIPLLPNRIPIASLTVLSSKLPLCSFQTLDSFLPFLRSISAESTIHLISNLLAFTPPRYPKLSVESLEAYLRLLTTLLNALPARALDPPAPDPSAWQPLGDDSDLELDADGQPDTQDAIVNIPIDPRTRKRLQSLPSPSHLSVLLQRTRNTPALIGFVVALIAAWPSRKEEIMAALLAERDAGPVYVAQIYHTHIRDSAIGEDDNYNDAKHAALVLVLDLYTQALVTMGDDEFFSFAGADSDSDPNPPATSAARNPLSRADLIALTRKLMRLVWALYFSESTEDAPPRRMGMSGRREVRLQIREKAVRCLLAIHARDSRRPFMPDGHWQESTRINLQAFIEVAAREEEQRSRAHDGVVASARERAYFAPRLAILHAAPFALPFLTRAAIFQRWLATSKAAYRENNPGSRRTHSSAQLTIRRDHVAQDGFEQLQDVDLRGHIRVAFIDKLGLREGNAGHRGLYKEFFTAICKEVFSAERGLWFENEKHEIYPSPQSSMRTAESLKWFRFIGRILGKALYDGILIDFAFAGFFLAKWLGRQGYLDDLASLDPALYKGLIFLKHYAGDVEDLSLNFAADVDDGGTTRTIDLLPNGSAIPVTKENRLQYIYLISHFRLSWQIKPQSQAFFDGLSELVEPRWLKMFNQQELQTLLGGADSGIDVEDLRANTLYEGIYKDADNPTIVAFWNVVRTFDQKQRRALLHFVTSCSRAPLMGFKHLNPNFTIHDMDDAPDHLPEAATCSNLLLLPHYTNEAVLREKLLGAITSETGF